MKRVLSITLIVLLLMTAHAGAIIPPGPPQTERIDRLMDGAIARGLIAGGVVVIGSSTGLLFENAYGKVSHEPGARGMTCDTLFDIASLTKVVATTPAILKLAEAGRLSLVDPVRKWFPEFAGKGKDELLVLHLLTHTSGLDDFSLPTFNPLQAAIDGAAQEKIKGDVGSRFHYADINFILLGELVRRVTGFSLDSYTKKQFFEPLGMKDTGFLPGPALIPRSAPTVADSHVLLQGVVQDPTARRLGGVAGHAGLFSTAGDLALFCRMMLNNGVVGGVRVLSERAVQQMTAPYFSRGGAVVRGLGWDISSPFSSPRGNGFSPLSFGHTGYSGTSIWIDPATDTFVVLLTSRLQYGNVKEFSQLRSDLSSLAAVLFAMPAGIQELAHYN